MAFFSSSAGNRLLTVRYLLLFICSSFGEGKDMGHHLYSLMSFHIHHIPTSHGPKLRLNRTAFRPYVSRWTSFGFFLTSTSNSASYQIHYVMTNNLLLTSGITRLLKGESWRFLQVTSLKTYTGTITQHAAEVTHQLKKCAAHL